MEVYLFINSFQMWVVEGGKLVNQKFVLPERSKHKGCLIVIDN